MAKNKDIFDEILVDRKEQRIVLVWYYGVSKNESDLTLGLHIFSSVKIWFDIF